MMVTFISQCEKKALKKTRRVLDAFANRIGDNTWQTVITKEGLQAVHKLLKKTASKSTAVSCHWIRSRARSDLLWVVGKRHEFNEMGYVPVNRTQRNNQIKEGFALNTEVIALFSQMAGLFHDVGKAMTLFQEKIQPNYKGKTFEPYRHEWVSLRIFQAFITNKDDKTWLKALTRIDNSYENLMLNNLNSLKDGFATNPPNPFSSLPPIAKVIAWMIVSHHRLPQSPKGIDNRPSLSSIDQWLNNKFEACWNSPQCLQDDWRIEDLEKNWTFIHGTPFRSVHWQTNVSIVSKKILRNIRIFEEDWFNQQHTIHLSRLSLMLADHYYSSQKEPKIKWQDNNYQAYANTGKDEQGNKYLKQKLDEHNIAVGHFASKIAHELPQLKDALPTIQNDKEFKKKVPAVFNKDYGWQDNSYNLAKKIRKETDNYGFFGICKASTGKGKTRANARIMHGISEKGRCRFNVALGLRILTLQTGSALKKDLKLNKEEMALLIGSQAVKDLHNLSKEPENNFSENLGSESADSLLKDEMSLVESLPKYNGICSKWFKHDPKILKLIQAPVLVSTIDYLMPANEGIRGGRQIAPMLRLLTSDLVLDEPDDFGLDDLPALCRLVNWAGMLGSKVLLSTATISPSLASALFSAYQAGRKQFTQVNGEDGETSEVCCAWFDEFKKPKSEIISDTETFKQSHQSFVDQRVKNLLAENKNLRSAKIIPLSPRQEIKPSVQIANEIRNSVEELHTKNKIDVNDKQLSIGLIRMANINKLIQVSKNLLNSQAPYDTIVHFCIYHSQFPLLQRSAIEKQLDKALSRHDFDSWMKESGINEKIKKHHEKQHIFIVLATAVAEVGRDHDYDWAIVEPSSMRSIIQLAGRVQRHRKAEPLNENIHILSKNFKALEGKSPCFINPGYETEGLKYAYCDLNLLTDVDEFSDINAIPRVQSPSSSPMKKADEEPYLSFNQLEHIAQSSRLTGSVKNLDHAAQWWQHDITWCGELQRIQPFRKSCANDEFCLNPNYSGSLSWQKKTPKTHPPEYQNTDDIARQAEKITLEKGIKFWMTFDVQKSVDELAMRLNKDKKHIWKKFTYVSLRRLNDDTAEQWQQHPELGIYKN